MVPYFYINLGVLMIKKLRQKVWDKINKAAMNNIPHIAVVTVRESANTYHPPLHNRKCHQNSAWHLEHNKEVIAVARGYCISSSNGGPIVHFMCMDIWGNWFDPTLSNACFTDDKFYITNIYRTTLELNKDNCNTELKLMKEQAYFDLPWYMRIFCTNNENTF